MVLYFSRHNIQTKYEKKILNLDFILYQNFDDKNQNKKNNKTTKKQKISEKQNMFDDFLTVESQYLQQRRQVNNTKVIINFQESMDSLVQIDKLLQCLEFGDCKKEMNVINMFGDIDQDEQKELDIVIDESKTGKNILILILDAPCYHYSNKELSRLSNFTKFCPNLLSLHIKLNNNDRISYENIVELWSNLSTHLNELREIQFEMRSSSMDSKKLLEVVKHTSNINNLLSISFNFDFRSLSVKDSKLVYSQFNKLKKLNTLILKAPYSYQIVKPNEKLIANRQYKTLLRLVTKNISIASTKQWKNIQKQNIFSCLMDD